MVDLTASRAPGASGRNLGGGDVVVDLVDGHSPLDPGAAAVGGGGERRVRPRVSHPKAVENGSDASDVDDVNFVDIEETGVSSPTGASLGVTSGRARVGEAVVGSPTRLAGGSIGGSKFEETNISPAMVDLT